MRFSTLHAASAVAKSFSLMANLASFNRFAIVQLIHSFNLDSEALLTSLEVRVGEKKIKPP